jgi:hypothetical protein
VIKRFLFVLVPWVEVTVASFAQDTVDSVNFSLYAEKNVAAQSAACYGNYLIFVSKQVSRMTLYNLNSKKILYKLNLDPKTEMRGKIDVYHANNSSFSREKYDKNDPFPLLYVSHRENNAQRGVVEVYRIHPFHRNGQADYDSMAVEQVQTVFYPAMTDKNAMGSPWTAIDPGNGYMYTYSRNNRSKAPNRGKCRLSKFKIPPFKGDCDSVFLNDADILEANDLRFSAGFSQGACIYHGMMYIAQGVPQKNEKVYLRVVDLEKGKLIRTYNLHASGFDEEPEGCFIYNGKLMVATNKKNIYQLEIPIE